MFVGAQVARPGKQVVTLIGDGGFGISAMDMETLLRYKLPAVVVVLSNSSWVTLANTDIASSLAKKSYQSAS
jgi:acetolactate synthase I/II/III large subunit